MTGICALRTALRDALRTHQAAILDALGWGKRPAATSGADGSMPLM
jgi:hypothetical protein